MRGEREREREISRPASSRAGAAFIHHFEWGHAHACMQTRWWWCNLSGPASSWQACIIVQAEAAVREHYLMQRDDESSTCGSMEAS